MRQRYIAFNSAIPTTAAQAKVTTGTAILTTLQLWIPSGSMIEIVEWGISFDGASLATAIQCELLGSNQAATVTSLTPTKFGDPNAPASVCVGGSAATGFTATVENSSGSTIRMFDAQLVDPVAGYVKQFPLGERPIGGQTATAEGVRIRVTAGTAVNCTAYIVWAE